MATLDSGSSGSTDVSADINITPLADVMLVLLIIFMITAPLSTHEVKVTLPKANPHVTKPEKTPAPIDLAIKPDGSMFMGGKLTSQAELRAKLAVAAQQSPQPPLQIRADRDTLYKVVRNVLEMAKASGMVHIAFVTNDPGKDDQ